MIPWWWAIIALVAGNVIGWFICSLCVASEDTDKNQPRPK